MKTIHLAALVSALAALGCGDDLPAVPDASAVDAAGGDAGPAEPPAPSAELCERVSPGAGSSDPLPVALSRVHATSRFFRIDGDQHRSDLALVDALADAGVAEEALVSYGASLPAGCVMDATEGPRSPEVRDLGWATYIRPGVTSSPVEVDDDRVVIDLRGLTADEASPSALRASLEDAVGALTLPRHSVRVHAGHVSELGDPGALDAYRTYLGTYDPEDWEGPGAEALVVLTGSRMAPGAAELALALRLGSRARIVGEDIETAVAEMVWSPAVSLGLALRTSELVDRTTLERLPDRVPADVRTSDPLAVAETMSDVGSPPPLDLSSLPNERPPLTHMDPRTVRHEPTLDRSGLQAAVLILHGTLRRFFPYFDVVPDNIDERLVEQLDSVGSVDLSDRRAVADWLRHFLQALDDGHGFVFDMVPNDEAPEEVWLPLGAEFVGEALLVLASDAPGIAPGDEILAIDGQSVPELYEHHARFVSAASEGYRRDLVVRRLMMVSTETSIEVRAPGEEPRTVLVSPVDAEAHLAQYRALAGRPSGTLGSIGHPDVHYVNLHRDWVEADAMTLLARLDAAATSASALVVDMRGYPGGVMFSTLMELVGRVVGGPSLSARFEVLEQVGASRTEWSSSQQNWSAPSGAAFDMPVAWIVGPHTVSAAENITQIVVGAGAVTVVGRQSASTNGNITGVDLPGRFVATFTGMRVLDPDGSRFHGVGIQPDVEATHTPEALRDGRDLILEAAADAVID